MPMLPTVPMLPTAPMSFFIICPIEIKAENIKEKTDSDLVNTTDRADATDIADFIFYLSDWK